MIYGPSIIQNIFDSPTENQTSLERTPLEVPVYFLQYILNLSTKDKSAEFMPSPKCTLFGGPTVYLQAYTYVDDTAGDMYKG